MLSQEVYNHQRTQDTVRESVCICLYVGQIEGYSIMCIHWSFISSQILDRKQAQEEEFQVGNIKN